MKNATATATAIIETDILPFSTRLKAARGLILGYVTAEDRRDTKSNLDGIPVQPLRSRLNREITAAVKNKEAAAVARLSLQVALLETWGAMVSRGAHYDAATAAINAAAAANLKSAR